MSGRFVRASKFRHVVGVASKKTESYQEVSSLTTGEGNYLKANTKFLAVAKPGGGGPVTVHNLDKLERFDTNHPTVNVHKAKVLDFDWNPFVDTLLATAAEDNDVKISVIPDEGLTDNITEAIVELKGHQKKAAIVHFHPAANNVLASSGYDHVIKFWDIEKQAEIAEVTQHTELIQSFEWNMDGSLVVSTCKDKLLRVFDPRQPSTAMSTEGMAGGKSSRAVWIVDKDKICVAGFSKTSMRQIKIWDPRKLGDALSETDLDQSAGVLMPFYDPDTSILYLGGKGDGNIRYFEVVDEEPFLHILSEYRSNEPQKGLEFLAKRACDTNKCEIARALRLNRDWIEPVSFQVPRKSDNFQADIYPDTYAGIPASSADDWISGTNRNPPLMSMDPALSGAIKSDANPGSSSAAPVFKARKSPAELEQELAAAYERIKVLEAQLCAK
uniref:Coronin n=1 Tax=Spongospora subterranea TaxID=70186 RepID=A0A0H5R7V6_9EUKA|eukprot:CRZ09797.1 hypothetical protein [Spongospora subterranea]